MSQATVRPDGTMIASLQSAGLLVPGEPVTFEALTGGVSSDIWKVASPGRVFCVKCALPRLKVAAVWEAPVDRNRFEVMWYRLVREIEPAAVPRVLHHDEKLGFFAMDYLDPAGHRLWKSALRDGQVDVEQASAVGRRLGRIHDATAYDATAFDAFPPNDIFQAIRLEPYLEATAAVHPDLAATLVALSRRTSATRRVMIHGDVSPKNILIGPSGPVFLDAECACIGDPAFDVAFCLNHLLLKGLWNPSAQSALHDAFSALAAAYMAEVAWETASELESRVATLLPALLLARVDGKSPVEYLTRETQRVFVRNFARAWLDESSPTLATLAAAWHERLQRFDDNRGAD